MIITLFLFALSYLWMLKETNWLRVRLPMGEDIKVYARYVAYNSLKAVKGASLHEGTNKPEQSNKPVEKSYDVFVSPGISNVLCGWEWLDKHCAAMVGYQPKVFMHMGGVRYDMTIRDTAVIKDVMKANKMTQKQKAYALKDCT